MAQNNVEFTVSGIESEEDARSIEDELGELEGVLGVQVERSGTAEVKYDYDILSGERVKATVREMGYEVE